MFPKITIDYDEYRVQLAHKDIVNLGHHIFSLMTIDDIKALIAADESRTLELKKTTGELKDGMHSACAFLNTDGGWLIIGITPKSLKIIGQEVTDSTKREIAQALSGIEPAVDAAIEYVDVPEHPGNKVIAMHFDGWAKLK